MKLGPADYAMYPFLDGAGELVKSMPFKLEDFGNDGDLRHYVEGAIARISMAVEEGGADVGGKEPEVSKRPPEFEIYTFILAVILVARAGNGALRRKFALAEARRCERFLRQGLGRVFSYEKDEKTGEIFQQLFKTKIRNENNYCIIPVADYLRHAAAFSEKEWDLVNRNVSGGEVRLQRRELARLIRNEAYRIIMSRLPQDPGADMPGLEWACDITRTMASRFGEDRKGGAPGGTPPCIKHAITSLDEGVNLPHTGRFMLATYMIAAGAETDDIVALFRNAPDYNEKVTRYQVGSLSSGVEGGYKCPGCDRIKMADMCHPDSGCEGIVHPLQYRGKK